MMEEDIFLFFFSRLLKLTEDFFLQFKNPAPQLKSSCIHFAFNGISSGKQAENRRTTHIKSAFASTFYGILPKRSRKKWFFFFTFVCVCIPQVDENAGQRCGENQTRTLSSRDRIETGFVSSAAAVCVTLRATCSQQLRSLSSSVGRYHGMRRDAGGGVGRWCVSVCLKGQLGGSVHGHPPERWRSVATARLRPERKQAVFGSESQR